MAESPNPPELVNAYRLIKAGQKAEAATLLKTYLAANGRDARGWWLMAHVVDKPENVRRCLENVIKLDPTHSKAREKLAQITAPPAEVDDEPDDAYFGVLSKPAPRTPSRPAPRTPSGPAPRAPSRTATGTSLSTQDLDQTVSRTSASAMPTPTFEEFLKTDPAFGDPFASPVVGEDPFAGIPAAGQAAGTGNQPDWGPGLAFIKDGTGSPPRTGSKPAGGAGFDAASAVDDEHKSVERMLKIGLIGVALIVLVGLVIYALVEFGGDDRGVPDMTALDGGSFVVDYPEKWDMRCASDVNGYPVCGIANHEFYNEVEWFAGTDVDLGTMISEGFSDALFGGYDDLPPDRVSIIVMDVPRTSPSYDNGSWAKTQYEWAQRGLFIEKDATIDYARQDITLDGLPAYSYRYTYQGSWTEAAWDVYIEHDGIILWLRATYWADGHKRIPEDIIQAMIDSIDLKPPDQW